MIAESPTFSLKEEKFRVVGPQSSMIDQRVSYGDYDTLEQASECAKEVSERVCQGWVQIYKDDGEVLEKYWCGVKNPTSKIS